MSADDPSPTVAAPPWAWRARILSALHGDIPHLPRFAGELGGTVVVLYHAHEVTNGWCPGGTLGEVAEFIRAAHDVGLKAICYYDSTLVEERFPRRQRDRWAKRDREGAPRAHQPWHLRVRRHVMCFNSPWSDHVARVAADCARVGADGLFMDNPDHCLAGGESCFCENCRREFRRRTGGDLFEASEPERAEWMGHCYGEYMRKVRDAMRDAGDEDEPVVTCNVSGDSAIADPHRLRPYQNVLFRETFNRPGLGGWEEDLEMDLLGQMPVWSILTELPDNPSWHLPGRAAAELEPFLSRALEAGVCPMVWTTIPSHDPDAPGFTGHSLLEDEALAAVVARHFRGRDGA